MIGTGTGRTGSSSLRRNYVASGFYEEAVEGGYALTPYGRASLTPTTATLTFEGVEYEVDAFTIGDTEVAELRVTTPDAETSAITITTSDPP